MKAILGAALAALVLASTAAPALADHDEWVVIVNKTDQDIGNISARPGKFLDFKRIPPGNKRKFTLRMPDGVCETTLTTVLPDGQSFRDEVEVCGGLTFTWGLAIE